MKYTKKDLGTTITGFFMALADSVPGVSGGTIIYIVGKYEQFVDSIASLSRKSSKEQFRKSVDFLIKLLIGWSIGMVLSLSIIGSLLIKIPYELISLFFGFVLISIPFIIKQENLLQKISVKNIFFTILGIVVVVFLSSFSTSVIDFSAEHNPLLYLYLFIVGAISISAMVLPGISGSTFLLIFGVYVPIVNAVKLVLQFNFTYLDLCIAFGLGVLLGIAYFSRLAKYLFKHYRNITIFFIVGLLIGSLYSISLGPTSLADHAGNSLNLATLNFDNVNYFYLLAGVAVIVILEVVKNLKKLKQSENN